MTAEVKLSYPEHGVEVDLTGNDIQIEHLFNNPIIVIPTPISATPVGASPVGATEIIGINTKVINIGFVAHRFILTFTLLDGLGSLDFSGNGTTKYEKIGYISANSSTLNPKTLTINGADVYVHVESFHFTLKSGDKDLMLNCSVNCIATDSIKMV